MRYLWFMPKNGTAQLHWLRAESDKAAACGQIVRVAPISLPGAPVSRTCETCRRAWQAGQGEKAA